MTTMANAAEQKREDERRTIEAFSDFSNIYNFKKDFTYSYKTEAGLTEDIVPAIYITLKRTLPIPIKPRPA